MERQSNAPFDWDVDGTSPYPDFVEQDPEQQSGDPNEVPMEATFNPVIPTPPPMPPQPLWDQTLGRDNWSRHSMHQRMGIVRYLSSITLDILNIVKHLLI